jgi:hypothetical protein
LCLEEDTVSITPSHAWRISSRTDSRAAKPYRDIGQSAASAQERRRLHLPPAPSASPHCDSNRKVKPIEIIMACEAGRISIGEVELAGLEPATSWVR